MVGKEIIQSRVWIDPNASEPPKLNYKNTYPITVYEAVKESMDDDAPNLADLLKSISQDLKNKQPIFPGKPANFLMTFAGTPGAVGSIAISKEVPWDPTKQRHDRIPTEKAVGDLLFKLGLVDEDGNIDPNGGTRIDWNNVIGRPRDYDDLGMNVDGFINQKGVTLAINDISNKLDLLTDDTGNKFDIFNTRIDNHISNKDNPHHVTLEQIGAASKESFDFHVDNFDNPHKVTKLQIGLDNVDNTSDVNKPISKATQDALDVINRLIADLNDDTDNYVLGANYDQSSGKLTLALKNGSTIVMHIPINGLIDEVVYNKNTKELVITELGGVVNRVDVSDLFIRYLGSIQTHITLKIDETTTPGNYLITATLNARSITDGELADNSVITRIIKDQNVTTDKIKDLSITTIKLKDQSVTTDKIEELAVTTAKIADRSVIGKKLFSSMVDNRILGVLSAGEDPAWIQINSGMISDNAVRSIHILNKSIIADKLDDKAVVTSKLDDLAVTTDKLGNLSVTNGKINNSTITGGKLVTDIILPGMPKIESRPSEDANNNQITDTFWVNDRLDKIKFRNDNILDRAINGRTLFTSAAANKALVVLEPNSDPVWGEINNDMMAINSVGSSNIINGSITDIKIDNLAIKSRHISDLSIMTNHIQESAVDSTKIWKSPLANRVLASLTDNSHPVYTIVNRDMIGDSAVGTNQLADDAVTTAKIASAPNSNRLLGVINRGTDPAWIQANNGMLGDKSVDGRVLFNSPLDNRVLAVCDTSQDPSWIQINGKMILDRTIQGNNIALGAIYGENLQEKSIDYRHIADRGIKSINIAGRAITGSELFTSSIPNRILAISTEYSNPDWMQVVTDMIKDQAITREKIFQSKYPYRVLGVTQADVPPEYLKITSDFIVDNSIIPQKLIKNFVLYGVPEMTERPSFDADNRQIPDTYWVRKTVGNMIKDFNPTILFDTISTDMIEDGAIDGNKLFTYPHAPRVIGITEAGGVPEYVLIEEHLIVDGAVTQNKLQRDITLFGSPKVEVRPSIYASDAHGGGNLIPDCQWVLDAIGSGGGTGGGGSPGGGGPLVDGSVINSTIANRAVTGNKLFTSVTPNRILGVVGSNTDAQYLQLNNEMIGDRTIDGRVLFSSQIPERVLAVTSIDSDPSWTQITYGMMADNSIGLNNIRNNSVSTNKLSDYAVTQMKLDNSPIIDTTRLVDNSVNSSKLADNAVVNSKILDRTIQPEKLVNNIQLPGRPTVAADSGSSYATRSLRSTIISPDAPSGGQNGDIWLRYI